MRKFEFPLESVLRLRRFHEQQARSELQAAIAARDAAEEALQRTIAATLHETRRLADRLSRMSAAEVANTWIELERLDQLRLKQTEVLAERENDVVVRREAYLAAQRERKPIDRLKEEMQKAHIQREEQAEQAILDELATIGFTRKGGGP